MSKYKIERRPIKDGLEAQNESYSYVVFRKRFLFWKCIAIEQSKPKAEWAIVVDKKAQAHKKKKNELIGYY